jgi:predicted dehydrogenase
LNGKYTPGQWRKILDYGCGTLGDMGVHLFDTPCRALGLRYPTSVKATCREPNNFSHPTRSIIEFEYPGTPFTAPTLHMTWYDGLDSPSVTPSKNPDLQLEEGRPLPKQGAMFVGENGKRMLLQHPGGPEPLPRSLLADFKKPNLPKIDHYHQWVDAAMGTGSCAANLDYAVPLTISNLLGVVATGFPGQSLAWNSETMKFSNNDAANGLLTANYRKF